LSDGRVDKAQFIVRSHQGTTTGTERSSVLGGKQEERARSERVAVGHSMLVRQPPGMTCLRESNDVWTAPVGLTSQWSSEVMTCATARDWTDGLSKVMRRSAFEVVVGQHMHTAGT